MFDPDLNWCRGSLLPDQSLGQDELWSLTLGADILLTPELFGASAPALKGVFAGCA